MGWSLLKPVCLVSRTVYSFLFSFCKVIWNWAKNICREIVSSNVHISKYMRRGFSLLLKDFWWKFGIILTFKTPMHNVRKKWSLGRLLKGSLACFAWPCTLCVLNYTRRQSRAMLLSYSWSNSNYNCLKSYPSNKKRF